MSVNAIGTSHGDWRLSAKPPDAMVHIHIKFPNIKLMKAKSITYLSSIILVSCLFLIVTGSPILTRPIFKESAFPSGTLISWTGLIALTSTIYFAFKTIHLSGSSNHKIFRFVFGSTIIFAFLWGLIGFLLAKNWAFTFQNHDEFRGSIEASRYFWIYTASIVSLPILLFLILWLVPLSKRIFRRSKL